MKTSSTELAELRKSVVEVGVGGGEEHGSRAEPVGKHEVGSNKFGDNEVADEVDDKVGKN